MLHGRSRYQPCPMHDRSAPGVRDRRAREYTVRLSSTTQHQTTIVSLSKRSAHPDAPRRGIIRWNAE
jgi:hypothetical protein